MDIMATEAIMLGGWTARQPGELIYFRGGFRNFASIFREEAISYSFLSASAEPTPQKWLRRPGDHGF
jgi:hypothetical protein